MRERIDTTYAGLLTRLSEGGYLTDEEQARVPRILAEAPETQAFAAHELLRRLLRSGRLVLHDGRSEHPASAITAADERRGLLFVLPPLRVRESGVLHPPLDPTLGAPPALRPEESLRLFNRVGRELLSSIHAAADLKTIAIGVLDMLRELLDVPAALASGRALPLPGGVARGPRNLILGTGVAAASPRAEPPADSPLGLPPGWEYWVRRAAESDTHGLYLCDFRELDHPLPVSEGSALLLPLRSSEPQWEAVLAAVSPRPCWFDEERLARARLLRGHAGRMLSYAIRLQTVISVDFLTGVNNRSYFVDQFVRALAGATRRHQSFALLIVDIDDFRSFNSRHGYDAGDVVLGTIARALQHTLRATDVLARYGGEEFAVILAAPVTAAEARQIGERLRLAVENLPVAVPTLAGGSQQVAVTVSIGGALFPADGRVRDELWHRANQMLLKAKASGKNRIHFPDEEDSAQAGEA